MPTGTQWLMFHTFAGVSTLLGWWLVPSMVLMIWLRYWTCPALSTGRCNSAAEHLGVFQPSQRLSRKGDA
jgi:hypothetical protein